MNQKLTLEEIKKQWEDIDAQHVAQAARKIVAKYGKQDTEKAHVCANLTYSKVWDLYRHTIQLESRLKQEEKLPDYTSRDALIALMKQTGEARNGSISPISGYGIHLIGKYINLLEQTLNTVFEPELHAAM